MEQCKKQFSVKNPISTGTNLLISSLALMAEEGRKLGDITTELQECAYFCHISRESTCISSAYDLPAAANEIRGAKQRAEAGKSWLGVQELTTPTKPKTCYSGTSSTTRCQNLSDEASPLLILSVTRLTFSSDALCHQWGKHDSSLLKMEACRACFKGGKQVPSPVAATAQKASGMWPQGQRAQLLSACAGKGEEEETEKASWSLKVELEMLSWKGLHLGKKVA